MAGAYTKLSAKEYREYENEFFKKYDEYRTETKKLFMTPDISKEELTERYAHLKEKYKGYTDVFESSYCASITDEYLEIFDGGDVNAKKLCEESKKYIGKRVIYSDDENNVGILKDIIATVDDYYYVIETDDTNTHYCSCVGDIKLCNE